MSIQHISIKNGVRGNGYKHARYVSGHGKYADRDDVIFTVDKNLPSWASSAEDFFAAADELERGDYISKLKRKDGSIYEKLVKGRS